jgi:hypothetical protein
MKTEMSRLMRPVNPVRSPGLFKNLLYWIMDWDDEAFLEEGVRRMWSRRSSLSSLSPEALEFLRNYDGPENHGPPLTKRERRALERRLASQA